MCLLYVHALTVYDRPVGYLERDDDPLWPTVEMFEQQSHGLVALVMAGVILKAQIAFYWVGQPGGSENFDIGYTADWPEQVGCDLLRLLGGAA